MKLEAAERADLRDPNVKGVMLEREESEEEKDFDCVWVKGLGSGVW